MIQVAAYKPSPVARLRQAWRGLIGGIEDAALRFLLRRELKDANLLAHARRELGTIYDLNDKEDGPNKWVVENILELLAVFSRQGHSGSSAPYVVSMFKSLAMFDPIGPLTGADSEWNEVGPGRWQNNRSSRVFKDADGRAYDVEGRVFRDSVGCYTSKDSRVYIEFPYTPKTEYVDVVAEQAGQESSDEPKGDA